MAEIHQVDPDRSTSRTSDDLKEKAVVETNVSDEDVDTYADKEKGSDEGEELIYRADKTELTPVEAFKWNVDGDQSPCEYLHEDLTHWTHRL